MEGQNYEKSANFITGYLDYGTIPTTDQQEYDNRPKQEFSTDPTKVMRTSHSDIHFYVSVHRSTQKLISGAKSSLSIILSGLFLGTEYEVS